MRELISRSESSDRELLIDFFNNTYFPEFSTISINAIYNPIYRSKYVCVCTYYLLWYQTPKNYEMMTVQTDKIPPEHNIVQSLSNSNSYL